MSSIELQLLSCYIQTTTCMHMIRTQVQMEPAQYKALKELAGRQSVSISQLVRDGVDHVLSQQGNEKDKWEQLFEAVGSWQLPIRGWGNRRVREA